jgi:hypothetical protein
MFLTDNTATTTTTGTPAVAHHHAAGTKVPAELALMHIAISSHSRWLSNGAVGRADCMLIASLTRLPFRFHLFAISTAQAVGTHSPTCTKRQPPHTHICMPALRPAPHRYHLASRSGRASGLGIVRDKVDRFELEFVKKGENQSGASDQRRPPHCRLNVLTLSSFYCNCAVA